MSYIGATPAESYASFYVQHFTTSATTSYALDYPVVNENDLRLVINNVVQQPGSGKAYTATASTLTLSAATTTSDTMYTVFLGRALQTVNPSADSVGVSQLADTVISGQTALGAEPADTDEFLVSDAGTLKRMDYSHIKSGGGGVLQIKQTVLTTTITQAGTNGTWFDATGLSVDITPTLSTSKILVNVCITIAGGASGGAGEQYQIVRDSTAIAIATDASGNRTNTTAGCAFDGIGGNYNHTRAMMFIDAPATTSATTYKVQIGGETSYSVYVNRSGANSDVAYHGNCASTITVMELAVGVL